MKFTQLFVLAAFLATSDALKLDTLPDERADKVADADIAAHEAARAEAAKVKKNPQASLLQAIKADLEIIDKDLQSGVSFAQSK
jgi:hypothetical protein